ncbi:hypothetical protein [Ammoniphilus sp. CFH 90114]|uniref:hypothetical protein n=1 Tax=Ammoniphilus sp. CFH 90114 TaxID=2493665 RepID=UPI0034CE19F3
MEKEIKKRQRGEAVRLELDTQTSEVVREFLKECLEIEEGDIYSISGPLDATFYMRFASLPGYEHLSHHPCNS